MIARKCAQQKTGHGNSTPFEGYISIYSTVHDNIVRLREEEHLGTMINCSEYDPQKKYFDHQKDKVSSLKRELKAVEEQLKITLKRCNLPLRSGPVTSSLDEALKEQGIHTRAYHERSSVGNHCHKAALAFQNEHAVQRLTA